MGNITYVLEWMETVYPDSLQQYQPERGKSNGNQDTLITILNPESWLFLKNSQGRAISDSTSSPDAGDGNPREERMHRILIRNKISETNLFNRVTAF